MSEKPLSSATKTAHEEAVREAIAPHSLIHYSGDAILMVKEVS